MDPQAPRRWNGLAHWAAAFLCLPLLPGSAFATWSIVVVDTRTREVCIAGATCIENIDLRKSLPVIRVGTGAAVEQAFTDFGALNRNLIRRGFLRGAPPAQILFALAHWDGGHEARQYGIVDLVHDPVTFTGYHVEQAKFGMANISGDLRYAIQGNVLTGSEVVIAAETALLSTSGDLGQRVMAAMEAARRLGGDGRCSCDVNAPTSCGAPPPNFQKAAHTAFIQIARLGDTDGPCNHMGCAQGLYYLNLNQAGPASAPDPVILLKQQYDQWRLSWIGRADHVLSQVSIDESVLWANGEDRAHVQVRLIDIDGTPLTHGGAALLPQTVDGAPGHATVAPYVDEGEGRYSFDFVAGTVPGLDEWRIMLDDGLGTVTLVQTIWLNVM